MDAARPGSSSHESYEAMKERLVSRGYLQKPLDRFILSGIARPGSFLLRHSLIALRIALTAGPLLGLLFALAVVAVNRPRFSRALDGPLLGFYFSVVFGAVVFVLELAAGLVLGAMVRVRRRGVARAHAIAARAGFAVSLLLSAYLALWWRRRGGGAGGPVLDTLGLLVLVLVNGLLFRVSSLASLAALIRASDLPLEPPTGRHAARWMMPLAASLLLASGFVLVPRGRPAGLASPFEAVAVTGRLVVVGWDGVPADLFAEWVRSRAESEANRSSSYRAALMPIEGPGEGIVPPRPAFWSGIATGVGSAVHGVGDVLDDRIAGVSSPLGGDVPMGVAIRALFPGRRVAVNARDRRAPTLWEILGSRSGVGVVGWWATWPALDRSAPDRPFDVVSDRALFSLRRPVAGEDRIAPAALANELRASFGDDQARARREGSGLVAGARPPRQAAVRQAALIDGYAALVAGKLLEGRGITNLFLYLPGLDIVRAGAGWNPGEEGALARSYAAFAGARIEDLARVLTADDWLVVIADQGRAGPMGSRPGGGGSEGVRTTLVGPGGRRGSILITGPGVSDHPENVPVEPWAPQDVAPTLLNLRGLPRSRAMEGEARVSFLSQEWRSRLIPRTIDTYGDNPVTADSAGDATSEQEILERLRSLGYAN